MKKLLLFCLSISIYAANAQQLSTPQPSPSQTLKQNFSTGSIELSYSRPGVKGRKIFGDLVPFGKVWRTGANAATTISFSDDVTIGGKEIKAGKYGLLSIPGETEWTIIITKDLNVTSPAAYNPDNDLTRTTAKPTELPFSVENFTIFINDITGTSCNMELVWANTFVSVPITTNTDVRVMEQIDKAVAKDNRPYFAAATYYFENNKDITKAGAWVDKAIADNPNAFYMYLLKAKILAKQGNKIAAKEAAKKTIELATSAKNDYYVKQAGELLKTL